MNAKTTLLFFNIIFFALSTKAQVKKLEKAGFQKDIVDQWWSYENKEAKKDCDMRILIIRNLEFELNCINWTAGFLGNKCAYNLTITDNFFELKAKNCKNDMSPGYLYGYLSETDNLFLLVRKKQQAISAALLSEKDWIKFEKIKR